jgi:hypothetical protein
LLEARTGGPEWEQDQKSVEAETRFNPNGPSG